MTFLFDKTNPIQPEELTGYQPALEKTQGNILKGHGRLNTLNVFLTFTGDRLKLRDAIRELASKVTSAAEQSRQTELRKQSGVESLFVGFGLSFEGYQYLGWDTAGFKSEAFVGGMTRTDSAGNSILGDPLVSKWEAPYQKKLHAIILLAHAVPSELANARDNLVGPFAAHADITTEPGAAILNSNKEPIEQFGFVDGVSQPLFFQSDIPAPPGQDQWDPGAGTNQVLAKDPLGETDDDCGSYFVFRKLEQDVTGFRKREAALQSLLPADQHPELAGAFIVGRFRDGTPVALSPKPQSQPKPENNFIHKGKAGSGSDRYERFCPMSAHIRKVNPRGDTDFPVEEQTHRIARRGITYGSQEPNASVGLLFQCCQRSLEIQFEFLQGTWINRAGTPMSSAGVDPVAGGSKGSSHLWPAKWDTQLKVPLDFGTFVTLQGGGYFFLPSITFLKRM